MLLRTSYNAFHLPYGLNFIKEKKIIEETAFLFIIYLFIHFFFNIINSDHFTVQSL